MTAQFFTAQPGKGDKQFHAVAVGGTDKAQQQVLGADVSRLAHRRLLLASSYRKERH
jgi:hypothetical protein